MNQTNFTPAYGYNVDPSKAELNNRIGYYGGRLLELYNIYTEIHPKATRDDFLKDMEDLLNHIHELKEKIDKKYQASAGNTPHEPMM